MSKRTKLKMHKMQLFLAKNVFNSRFIVRNILALTILTVVIALGAGTVMVAGSHRKAASEASAEEKASGSVEETLDGSVALMNAAGTDVLRADLEATLTAGKEAKDKEVVSAAAASEFADKFAANRDDVNVRAEASTDSQIVGRMDTGACGDVVSQADGWVQISSGDVKGYVKADYVTVGTDAYALAQEYYSATAVAKEDGINLRAAADKSADVVGAVYENVTYNVAPEKTNEDWVCLEIAEGTEGYASADYMEVTEGYRVAEVVDQTGTEEEEADTTEEDAAETEKHAEGSVTENKKTDNKKATTQATTQAATTEATTQKSNNEANIGTTRTPISLSDADINLMAAVMTLECGGESYEGQLAVANVILNRLQMGIGGNTISDVVYAPYQFSVVSDSRFAGLVANGAQASCIQAARDACAGNNNIGDMIGFRPTWNIDTSTVAAYKQIGNHIFFKY